MAVTNYSQYGWAVNDPEIGALIRQAEADPGSWTEARFNAAVQATAFWRNHSAAFRRFHALIQTDPAEAERQVQLQRNAISDMAIKLGVNLPGDALASMADSSVRFGWSEQELRDQVVAYFKFSPHDPQGQAAVIQAELRDIAGEYAMPISDQSLGKWQADILSGRVTTEQFQAWAVNQAKGRFLGLSNALDAGVTVRQYSEGFIQKAAQLLEVNPESIDLKDPKWSRFLEGRDEKGNPRLMSIQEWEQHIKQDKAGIYGYDNSRHALTEAAQYIATLEKQMGVRA